jgi:hypothetical protein
VDHGTLPYWVVEAFIKHPRPLDMKIFRSRKVLDIFWFFSQAEVFASSPLIEELDSLTQDEHFIEMFEKFLLGQPMGS